MIRDYFEMQKNMISEYCRLLLNIRIKVKGNSNRLYNQPIIEEPSNEMNTSTNKCELPITNHSDRITDKSIAFLRKDIIRE